MARWIPALLALLASARADDWPQWMGPERDGVWREKGIVEKFPAGGAPRVWRTELGAGYSGPSVVNGQVFVMDRLVPTNAPKAKSAFDLTQIPGNERVLCLDAANGKVLWKYEYDCPYTVSYAAGPRVTPLVRDGKVFTLTYDNVYPADINIPLTVSDGAGITVSFGYGENNADPDGLSTYPNLSSITDAAGIKSYFRLMIVNGFDQSNFSYIQTPYGRTKFTVRSLINFPDSVGSFADDTIERWAEVWYPDGSSEAWATLSKYTAGDWPNWGTTQLPDVTGAIVSTMDTGERQTRNSFHWSRPGRAAMTKDFATQTLNWADIKYARIRHWLLYTQNAYLQWGARSWEQDRSPDGTAEGNVTWYDYVGKTGGAPNARGTESMPAVVARVIKDGASSYHTTYQSHTRNTAGNPTQTVERWWNGSAYVNRTSKWGYDSTGAYVTSVTNALNQIVERRGYDGLNRLTSSTNALSEVTRYGYDAKNRTTFIQRPAGWNTTNTYSPDDLTLTSVEFMAAVPFATNVTVTAYNQAVSRTLLNGASRSYNTRQVTTTDTRGLITTAVYDDIGRLLERWYEAGGAQREYWYYDLPPGTSLYDSTGGNLILDATAFKNRAGVFSYTTYDGLRRVVERKDPMGNRTTYVHCTCGGVTSVTEGTGTAVARTTSYDYDLQGKRKRTTFADTTYQDTFFDGNAWPIIVQDSFGYTTNYYDNLKRVVESRNANGRLKSTIYDALDRPIATTDTSGVTITNYFDLASRLVAVTGAGWTNSFGYSSTFQSATSQTNAIGKVMQFAFDAAQRKTNEIQVGLDQQIHLQRCRRPRVPLRWSEQPNGLEI